MVSSVHISILVSQFWPRQAGELFSLAHRTYSTVATPLKDHRPRPLCIHINVFAGLKQVQIIEVPDKRGPDNRGCTVTTYSMRAKPEGYMWLCTNALFHTALVGVC